MWDLFTIRVSLIGLMHCCIRKYTAMMQKFHVIINRWRLELLIIEEELQCGVHTRCIHQYMQ